MRPRGRFTEVVKPGGSSRPVSPAHLGLHRVFHGFQVCWMFRSSLCQTSDRLSLAAAMLRAGDARFAATRVRGERCHGAGFASRAESSWDLRP